MLIWATAIVSAAVGAVGVVFVLALPAGARPMKDCSAKYQAVKAGPKTQCGVTRRPPLSEIKLGIGDVVSVTIFEAAPGGLFVPNEAGARPGNFVTLPNQIVDSKGNITVPYVGAIRAAGRTPSEVQQAIVKALAGC